MSLLKDNISTKKIQKESITPHRLAVAILIRIFCQHRELDEFKNLQDATLKCKYRKDFCILTQKLLQSPDLSLLELKNMCSQYNIPQTVMESFTAALNALYNNGTGHLLDVIDSLTRIMMFNDNTPLDSDKSYIRKNSVVGYSLRRLIVNFDKLTFSEVTIMYLSFQRYYNTFLTSFTSDTEDDCGTICGQWTKRQAELFVATQATLLTHNEGKALPPQELHRKVSDLLKSNPNLPESFFLTYLNYLRVREFCGSRDNLYHCFDKSSGSDGKTYDEKTKPYRYAALNLAILHYHFGHEEEALISLKEAIKISQEASDNVCLQHSLSWLSHFTRKNRGKLIIHCISKSVELSLTYTTSLGVQNIGQYSCLDAENPLTIFENITKSDVINCQQNHPDLISNSYALKSSLWQFYGKTEMSSLWSQLLLYLNINCTRTNKTYFGEGFCLALCSVINNLMLLDTPNIVLAILSFTKSVYPNEPNSHIWMLTENVCTFMQMLKSEKWNDAKFAAEKISVTHELEGLFCLYELYFAKENYSEANTLYAALSKASEQHNDGIDKIYYKIRSNILYAKTQIVSFCSKSVLNGILTLLEESLIESKTLKLDYQTSLILLHIANVQFLMDLPSQTLKIINRCLIQILAHGGLMDRAHVMLLYVKCTIANSYKLELSQRTKVILSVMDWLNQLKKIFTKLEAYSRAKDVLFLQAHLYNNINDKEKRNQCALEFRLLDEEHTTKNFYTLVNLV